MKVAIVVYDGVLNAEVEAFASVLGLVRDVEVVIVGTHTGSFAGPGGWHVVDELVEEVGHVEVVVVPGGLGCERLAEDARLRDFLHRMEDEAQFVAASSTGTVALASAGLLHGHAAATHWLATDLLRKYGSEADARRLVVTGNVITCEGQISALEAAFSLVAQLESPGAVERIRATLIERGAPHLRQPSLYERGVERLRDAIGARPRGTSARRTPSPSEPPVTPLSVMVELVDNDELARRMTRQSRRRHRR